MASSWTVCVIFTAVFFSAGGVPLKEDPLVAKAKQIVANVNSYIKEHNFENVDLPDYGNITTDHIALSNVKMSNFSSVKYIQGPLVNKEDTQYIFYIEVGLDRLEYQYDFDIQKSEYQQQGHLSAVPKVNSFIIKGSVEISDKKSCDAKLIKVDLYQYGDFDIELEPDNIPNKDDVLDDILEFTSPSFVTWYTMVKEMISSIPSFDEEMSNIICQVLLS